jgi:hypothetical protein
MRRTSLLRQRSFRGIDQAIDLAHLRRQLALQALEAAGIEDALRLRPQNAGVCEDCCGSREKGVSIG